MLVHNIPVIHRETVDSTNLQAIERCKAGEILPFWIVSQEQTAGRGRAGRQWVSAPGNLYATLAFAPDCAVAKLPQLSFVAAIAVFETLRNWINPASLKLKWPNDCLVEGAKISGILLEVVALEPVQVVLGFGINVRTSPQTATYRTSCLAYYDPTPVAQDVFEELQQRFELFLSLWSRGENFSRISEEWLSRSHSLGSKLIVNSQSSSETGIFRGLNDDGALLLELPDGSTKSIYSGDIAMQHAESSAA